MQLSPEELQSLKHELQQQEALIQGYQQENVAAMHKIKVWGQEHQGQAGELMQDFWTDDNGKKGQIPAHCKSRAQECRDTLLWRVPKTRAVLSPFAYLPRYFLAHLSPCGDPCHSKP
jgi:hypothetical protein